MHHHHREVLTYKVDICDLPLHIIYSAVNLIVFKQATSHEPWFYMFFILYYTTARWLLFWGNRDISFHIFMCLFLKAIDNSRNDIDKNQHMFSDKRTSSSVSKTCICQSDVTWNWTSIGKCVPETINDIKWQYQQYIYGNRVMSTLFYMFNQMKDEVEISDIIKQRKIYRRFSSAIDILGSFRYSLNTEICLH